VPFPNSFDNTGAGLFGSDSRVYIADCVFTRNAAANGGGVGLRKALDTVIERCTFEWNRANVNGAGALIAPLEGFEALVIDCIFQYQNWNSPSSVQSSGGISGSGNTIVKRSHFLNNTALSANGAGIAKAFIDCTFIGNSADNVGAGGAHTLINCYVAGNFGIFNTGGMGAVNAINCTFENNIGGFQGTGALRASGDVINCTFIRNQCYDGGRGGAVFVAHGASPRFINCLFNGNSSVGQAGTPGQGGTIATQGTGFATLINCTIAHGFAAGGPGSALWGKGSMSNSIIWHNEGQAISGTWMGQYSAIERGWPGVGNIDADPQFVDRFGPDGFPGTADDDLRLLATSACIDAGDNTALPPDIFDLNNNGDTSEPLPIDLVGGLRRVNHPGTPNTGYPPWAQVIVDMGAYEFRDFPPLLGDVNFDGVVNVDDLLAVINAWGPCASSPLPMGEGSGVRAGASALRDSFAPSRQPSPGGRGSLRGACPADLNGDGEVNHADLMIVIRNWS
jgi:hypothetical protein